MAKRSRKGWNAEQYEIFLDSLRDGLWSLNQGRSREMDDPLDATGWTVREEMTALCAASPDAAAAREAALAVVRDGGADMSDPSAVAHMIAMRYFALAHQEAERRAEKAIAIDIAAGKALEPQRVTDAEFDAEVVASDMPVLVDYFSTLSRPSINISPAVARLAKRYEGRLKVVRVDVDRRDSRGRAVSGMRTAGSVGVPTFVLYNNGGVMAALIGPSADEVGKLAADVVGGRSLDG